MEYGEVLDHWSAAASVLNHIVESAEEMEREKSKIPVKLSKLNDPHIFIVIPCNRSLELQIMM